MNKLTMPCFLILLQQLFDDVDQALVGGFNKSISLGVIGSRVAQGDLIFMVEINRLLGYKSSSIICDYFPRTAKSGQYVGLKEF